ncbi:MAG: hypothetical protein R3211_11705, partial [Balneolaceae bacterium]|nr:hypothetical protein [Balneolaceae bacterium]
MAASETGNRFLETGDLRELLSEKRWLVEEEQFDPGTLNIYETLFTVGNGYLGTRGSLEEGHAAGLPRTFINGLFDHHQSFVVELANTPDWPELHLYVEGIKLGIHECEILDHYRALDMRSGCLFRETRFRDKEGRITRYQSLRYAHWDEKHLCELQVQLTPENYNGVIEVEAPIDANVFNLDLKPAYKDPPTFDPEIRWEKWARSMHLGHVVSEPIEPKGIFLKLETLDRPHHLGYASALEADTDVTEYRRRFQHKRASEVVRLEAKKGEPLRIRKAVAICTSRDQARDQIRPFCEGQLQGSLSHSFLEKFERHRKAWNRLWDACDIIIKGDPEANRAVRFNIYHLLIAANPEDERA